MVESSQIIRPPPQAASQDITLMPAPLRWFAIFLVCAPLSVFAARGYVVDGDGDAVSDEIDDCPYTRPGTRVDAKGCPLQQDDADVDGIADDADGCPYSAAGAVVDVRGCALDSDFDGVADGVDRCPSSGFALPVNDSGCVSGESPQAVARAAQAMPAPPPVLAPAPSQIQASRPPAARAVIVRPVVTPTPAVPLQTPIIAVPAAAKVPTTPAAVESPVLLLSFNVDSMRLGEGDIAAIAGYARIFARHLAADPKAKLELLAYADRREADLAELAVGRMALVRNALVGKGIPADRIRAESGVLDGEDAGRNRRVEVHIRR